MEKVIKNNWRHEPGTPLVLSRILSHEVHPEGLDIDRVRFVEDGSFAPDPDVGHIISIIRGQGNLHCAGSGEVTSYHLESGVHLYLPPHRACLFDADEGTEFIRVSSASAAQARGRRMLLRDEAFLAACSSGSRMLRWILTPQYLSRRIFLHHDPVLLSKDGSPVSWFRTTMFDVAGLPRNEEGEPVFKMSYNSRTECNICYDVRGTARVRMAQHPYSDIQQAWDPWSPIDDDTTYHLNEAAGGPEEERRIDRATRTMNSFRNKHEVSIVGGHVTLFCLFDPAPTGMERHRPGEYSDYEPLWRVIGTAEYETYQREIARCDEMVDRLSVAKATGILGTIQDAPVWRQFMQGREAQSAAETRIAKTLAREGTGREAVLSPWMQGALV